MRIYFSWKVTGICVVLAGLMVRASFWQWDRYQQKQAYIQLLTDRLNQPVVDFSEIVSSENPDWKNLIHRRIKIRGTFDFEHEMALRNRRYQEISGVYAITPLKIENSLPSMVPKHILVSRGFEPLSKASREGRKEFQKDSHAEFIGLIKESVSKKFFAPSDPEAGPDKPWVDAWLRVDIPKMGKQLPYPVLPVYLEIMEAGTGNMKSEKEKMIETRSGRDEIFFFPSHEADGGIQQIAAEPDLPYPIPVYDTVIPPGRHYGYVWEWAIMAIFTALIGVVLQLKPPRKRVQ